MRTYLFKNPGWFSWPYQDALWQVDTKEKVIYLTFDDGPHPQATPYVMELLDRYQAKATFFCIGKEIARYPGIMDDLLESGHAIGNHTFTHANGWKASSENYLREVEQCQSRLDAHHIGYRLFRPPYGNIRFGQLRKIRSQGYQVVMWSHLSGDFDPHLNVARSLEKLRSAGPGSILVFHDSEKALENLRQLLPRVLDHFSTLGYSFKTLRNA